MVADVWVSSTRCGAFFGQGRRCVTGTVIGRRAPTPNFRLLRLRERWGRADRRSRRSSARAARSSAIPRPTRAERTGRPRPVRLARLPGREVGTASARNRKISFARERELRAEAETSCNVAGGLGELSLCPLRAQGPSKRVATPQPGSSSRCVNGTLDEKPRQRNRLGLSCVVRAAADAYIPFIARPERRALSYRFADLPRR